MGVIDYLQVEYKDIKPSTGDYFCTKQFSCMGEKYKLDEEGKLHKRLSDAWYPFPHEGYFSFYDGTYNYSGTFVNGKITNMTKI